jgi:hypothetical protein
MEEDGKQQPNEEPVIPKPPRKIKKIKPKTSVSHPLHAAGGGGAAVETVLDTKEALRRDRAVKTQRICIPAEYEEMIEAKKEDGK